MTHAAASAYPQPSKLSVIIPTKNRPAELEHAVSTIFSQTVAPRQLIIVDQSESRESRGCVERKYRELPRSLQATLSLHYVHDVTIRGANAARNRGMDLAQGQVWLVLDDDVSLEPEFVEELLSVYRNHPEVTGVSGIITNYQPPSVAFRAWSWLFARGPFYDERQPIYWRADSLRHAEPLRVGKMGSGLMSFRAEAVRDLRFDETVEGLFPGDDVDFCARLGSAAVLMITPRARLAHTQSPAGRGTDHWLKPFAQAHHYVYKRNWRFGLGNRLAFAWLNLGCGLVATFGSVRQRSLTPWRAFREGMRDSSAGGI